MLEEAPSQEPEVSEEDLGGILYDTLLDYIEAVKNDHEYDYFSQQTRQLVGSPEEYVSGAKSDIYFIIKESTSNVTEI